MTGLETRMEMGVEAQYATEGLTTAIQKALEQSGKSIDSIGPEDLAPIDELHVRGRKATLELAERLGLTPGMRVLDVGSGLGGPSRLLADAYGCEVTGIDLSASFCETATALAGWTGLGALVDYRAADALDMPFADESFDIVWSQHASMNIEDKETLYAETRRVLHPGGRFALYDVLQGPGGEVRYPVPWAEDPSISHLATVEELRRLLTRAGFKILHWEDRTEAGRDWFARMAEKAQGGPRRPLGVHLIFGEAFGAMMENQRRNLEERRVALVEAICRRI